MAAYRRVYDSRHLQADCQEPGSAPEPYARLSSTGYLYLFQLTNKRNELLLRAQRDHVEYDSYSNVRQNNRTTTRSLLMLPSSHNVIRYNPTPEHA